MSSTLSEQIEVAARRSELNSLRYTPTKDPSSALPSPRLRPASVESASCIHLLTRRTDSATPKASTLSFLDGKLREIASHKLVAEVESAKANPPAPKLFGVSLNNKTTTTTATATANVTATATATASSQPPTAAAATLAHHKRPRAASWGPDGDGHVAGGARHSARHGARDVDRDEARHSARDTALDDARHGARDGERMKVELGLELRPRVREEPSSSSVEGAEQQQPWLRISASCGERVFM